MATLKERWAAGDAVVGLWGSIGDPVVLEIEARAGYDYVTVDLQHGFNTWASLPGTLRVLRGTGAAVLVRVQSCDPVQITRALDLGADGVVVPMIESADEARAAVAAVRYPTTVPGAVSGTRSYGPVWADHDTLAGTGPLGDDKVCVLQIETARALAAIEEIVAVPGVDVAYVGPYDLALSSGLGGRTYRDSPEIAAMVQRVLDVAAAAGVVAGMHCDGPPMVGEWRARGARMLTVALDTTVVREAHQALAAAARQALTG